MTRRSSIRASADNRSFSAAAYRSMSASLFPDVGKPASFNLSRSSATFIPLKSSDILCVRPCCSRENLKMKRLGPLDGGWLALTLGICPACSWNLCHLYPATGCKSSFAESPASNTSDGHRLAYHATSIIVKQRTRAENFGLYLLSSSWNREMRIPNCNLILLACEERNEFNCSAAYALCIMDFQDYSVLKVENSMEFKCYHIL